MEYIPVVMVRENLEVIPAHPLPSGYRFRTYKDGDDLNWAEIEHAAGEFAAPEKALERFRKEFGERLAEMASRCFFLVHEESGRAIGTTTAWLDPDFRGRDYGRIHWVAIHPDFQGRGLSKPLVARAMQRLAESHERAYLSTQTTSARAVGVYLDLGFEPLLTTPRWEEAWAMLAEALNHPALGRFRPR